MSDKRHTDLRRTDARLQRLCLWLALWAAKFAVRVLGAFAPQAAVQMLNEHLRLACNLLLMRAIRRVQIKLRRRGSIPVELRRLRPRGLLGAALRRALRGKTLGDRARALCAVLADGERWIARIVRRLKRGFTRLRVLPKPRRARLRRLARAHLAARLVCDTT